MGRPKSVGSLLRRRAERRTETRVLVDYVVDYRRTDTYLFASIRDISTTGIFVRTIEPSASGTRLNLRFPPPAGADEEPALELEGEVIWVNPYRPGSLGNLDPGMGVRFVDLRPGGRERLLELIRRIAYID